MTRDRTIVDDVIDAMKRGVDEKTIRELGVLHTDLEGARIEGGYFHAPTVYEVEDALGIHGVRQSGDGFYDTEGWTDCLFLDIRFRLTGHTDNEIETSKEGVS